MKQINSNKNNQLLPDDPLEKAAFKDSLFLIIKSTPHIEPQKKG